MQMLVGRGLKGLKLPVKRGLNDCWALKAGRGQADPPSMALAEPQSHPHTVNLVTCLLSPAPAELVSELEHRAPFLPSLPFLCFFRLAKRLGLGKREESGPRGSQTLLGPRAVDQP